MILNKYKYLFVDGSYYLKKSNFIAWNNWLKSDKKDSYTVGDVSRMMIYSINKVMKEMNGVDKVFILWDAWAADIKGYYTTHILKGNYKDSRVYVTEEDAQKEDLTNEERQKILDEAYRNEMQRKSKAFIIDNLGNYGIPSIRYFGYEADNLIWIYSSMLAQPGSKKSAFASSDADWGYASTNPYSDFYKVGIRGAESKLIVYEDMIKEIPEELTGKISLYDWKAYYDSIEGSHNDMRRTRRDRFNTAFIIQNLIEKEDYTGIEDIDLFRLQYSTFRIEKFPNFQKIINEFNEKMSTGKLPTAQEFKKFSDDNGLGISERYLSSFIDRLDPKLYSHE